MTLRTSISAPEETRMLDESGTWVFRVETKRRTDAAWTDVTDVAGGDWVTAISVEGDTPDRPAGTFTVKFIRSADGYSLSPGIAASSLNTAAGAFSPLVYPGAQIRVDAACLSAAQTRATATWHRWLEGEIDRAEWPDDVIAQCSTLDAVLRDAQIEAEEDRGRPMPGMPLEEEFQQLLDRWMTDDPVTVLVVGDPDTGVGQYKTPVGSLGDFLLEQAQRIGWDARYRWDDASSSFKYTLYLPPRDKETPDLTLAKNRVYDVPDLVVDRAPVRNAFTIIYPDEDTGRAETRTAEEPSSRAQFRRRWMGMQEPQESSITTAAKADALLSYAKNDLSRPPTEKRIRIPFMPFLALHHMVRVQADGKHFDFDQDYSVVGSSHEVTAEGGAHTIVSLRGGSPVGMYYAWRRRAAPISSPEGEDGLINFREYTDEAGITVLAWDRIGTLVQEVWEASIIFDVPLPADPWALVRANAVPLPPGTLSVTYPKPGEGQRRLIQIETRLAFMEPGAAYRVNQFGTPAPIDWRAEPTETEGEVNLAVTVNDVRGVVSHVQFYTLILGVRSGPFPATVTAGSVYNFTLALEPKHPVGIQPELVRNDGFPPILGETYTADLDKLSTILDVRAVRTGDDDYIMVDSDTDTVSLHYKEDVAGVLGSETSIPARGTDPRFGAFTIQASETVERKFRIYGKNSAGNAGEYVDWRVPIYVPLPSLNEVTLSVVNRPNSGGAGYFNVYDVAWDVSSAVNDTDHGISVSFYQAGTLKRTLPLIGDPPIDPSDGTAEYADPVGGTLVTQHSAKVVLFWRSTGAGIGVIETPPVDLLIDTTPYP